MHRRKFSPAGFAVLIAMLLDSACVVGPNFQKPPAPQVPSYTPNAPAQTTATPNVADGTSQHLAPGLDIPADWWTVFHSQPLNHLIERTLKANPDLQSARSALLVARETTLAQRGYYYPTVTAGFAADRSRTSSELSPYTASGKLLYSLFTPEVSVAYTPDVFGLNRRTVESLQAQQDQARFALSATHITLSSNIAEGAIQEASLRGQVETTERLIAINREMLDTLRQQMTKGYAAELDVAAQESLLAQMIATLPPLRKQLAQQRDQLVALAGALPDKDAPESFSLGDFQLPATLPASLPSLLVEHRPDVRQAEENLHAASALIGVARANRLPSFSITGDAGSMALIFSHIFSKGGFWDAAAGVTHPLYDGGTLKHKERAARAAYDQAEAQYRSAVQAAFQNVPDTLHAIEEDANALKAASDAATAAGVTLDVTKQQLNAGYATNLALLTAEQGYQQAVLNVIQARANRLSDSAALFQALGGGWWNRPDLPKS